MYSLQNKLGYVMCLCLYYNETFQNQRASVWQWDGPESKSVYITMRRSRIKERLYYDDPVQNQRAPSHILLSPDLLLKILQKKNKRQSN